jgi:hypothetical protein
MHLETTKPSSTVHWLSDLHLDRASSEKIQMPHDTIAGLQSRVMIVSGDISSAPYIAKHLRGLAEAWAPRSLYFVLGNHDFYHGSIESVGRDVAAVCRSVPNLHHLRGDEIIPLGKNTGLIGHRGWADGRAGWGRNTIIPSRDHGSIDDFRKLSKAEQFAKMESLGKEAAVAFRRTLPLALSRFQHVVITVSGISTVQQHSLWTNPSASFRQSIGWHGVGGNRPKFPTQPCHCPVWSHPLSRAASDSEQPRSASGGCPNW